jgi:hypothetical protein
MNFFGFSSNNSPFKNFPRALRNLEGLCDVYHICEAERISGIRTKLGVRLDIVELKDSKINKTPEQFGSFVCLHVNNKVCT